MTPFFSLVGEFEEQRSVIGRLLARVVVAVDRA
jgi:hypothetical protein